MNVSLKQFLRTAVFAGIMPGTPVRQLVDMLGEPDDVSGRMHPPHRPGTYRYGSMKFYVATSRPYLYRHAFWDAAGEGAFQCSSRCVVLDWEWTPRMRREMVEAWLVAHGFEFDCVNHGLSNGPSLRLKSGANVAFTMEGGLKSVSTPVR